MSGGAGRTKAISLFLEAGGAAAMAAGYGRQMCILAVYVLPLILK